MAQIIAAFVEVLKSVWMKELEEHSEADNMLRSNFIQLEPVN